jgi:hypothetical protein
MFTRHPIPYLPFNRWAQTWTNINSGLPLGQYITYIGVKYNDPQTLWVTFGRYTETIKVYKSTDGGASWTMKQQPACLMFLLTALLTNPTIPRRLCMWAQI